MRRLIRSQVDSSIFESGRVNCCLLGFETEIENRMANSVDPDETANYEPSRLFSLWIWTCLLQLMVISEWN